MVEYIIGNYLVESGVITKEQFTAIAQQLDNVRVKLGFIAVAEGMMTNQQAEEINDLQAVRDMRFGDIAIEEGYLTKEQVDKLLKMQGNAYLMFMQGLIDADLIRVEEVDLFLNDFKRVNNYSNADLEDIKSDNIDRILPLILPEDALEYRKMIGTLIRLMIRLVDRHVYVGKAAIVDALPMEGLVMQKLDGTPGYAACLAERNGALLHACRIFGKEEFEVLNADALDAAGELLNCALGMFASDMSREGVFLELLPPEYSTATTSLTNICRIPVFIGNLGLYFVVGTMNA